jgi:hypothetical protein
MSTSPTFKYRGPDKRCPFPFDRDAVTVPTMTDAAYDGRHALLPQADGDEGLNEACRLFWLTESFTLTLTATSSSETVTRSFPRPSFPAPASRCSLEGQLALPDAEGGIVWDYSTTPAPTWGPDPSSGYQAVGIRYAQDVSRWCLVVQTLGATAWDTSEGDVSVEIGGPSPFSGYAYYEDFPGWYAAWSRTSAGSVTVFGYEFPLYKTCDTSASGPRFNPSWPAPPPIPSFGSVSATSSSTFYTLV